ncbi:cell division ATP-binding protein FtsE [Geobacter sulfurreducens]|uniref:Cell division ATP-binding protein FtsE n=1 Tax=Geobacter sulfurreducens (strain ATCC 51573 / DSM 12127 / PCA) TaxID=243231 RepID=Q74C99_GEOSL|nr:cell division ATP-binding protein FtsE [Geobacter sulfurreducens]AAR35152.1 cell division ATP-binding protein FtsE [Geobacter sulfurreducens PCA]ADI84610.1 cell division ATP-binding protein FtsE [Geobacter sulfurreducens KN400]AJY71218.1 cell division protein FtsE [Geobacter sulfurreducens]QVW33730.1 cell division ATP-binding protein FtsE [Geobacter sulfurreducens]UAC02522.1 cell division ATP-binding protein FtsE [Geobacter sulfurreducens]
MIQFHNVSMSYQRDMAALNDVTLKVPKGDFVFVTGPSGAGKSTLLKLVYAALSPSKGQVIVDGQNVTRMTRSQIPLLRRSVGVVFQDFKLLPNRTVLENVAITLEVLGWGKRDIGKKVHHILRLMGMEHKINATPLRLSGGEQQRVALARALVNDPKILLADEPTGNLDDENKEQILAIFREANIRGTTVMVATHDRRVIENSHKRVIILDKGRLVEDNDVPKQEL